MQQAKEINLRPRLTISDDLYPELYSIFSNTSEKRMNALVMQMLNRMAIIDFHGGGAIQRDIRTIKPESPTAEVSAKPIVERKPKKPAEIHPPPVDALPTEQEKTAALLAATGAMFMD